MVESERTRRRSRRTGGDGDGDGSDELSRRRAPGTKRRSWPPWWLSLGRSGPVARKAPLRTACPLWMPCRWTGRGKPRGSWPGKACWWTWWIGAGGGGLGDQNPAVWWTYTHTQHPVGLNLCSLGGLVPEQSGERSREGYGGGEMAPFCVTGDEIGKEGCQTMSPETVKCLDADRHPTKGR